MQAKSSGHHQHTKPVCSTIVVSQIWKRDIHIKHSALYHFNFKKSWKEAGNAESNTPHQGGTGHLHTGTARAEWTQLLCWPELEACLGMSRLLLEVPTAPSMHVPASLASSAGCAHCCAHIYYLVFGKLRPGCHMPHWQCVLHVVQASEWSPTVTVGKILKFSMGYCSYVSLN